MPPNGHFTRRVLLGQAALGALATPFIRRAGAAVPAIRIGCLTDLNGPYADLTGLGTVGSMKLAIEDFGKLHADIPVELVVAEFSLKPDVGLSIMRGWFDQGGVDAVADVPMSALALAAVAVLQEKNKVGLFTSPATADLTRGSCGPNHILFAPGTYCLAVSMSKAIIQHGGDSWFFILPDYAMGKAMVGDAERAVTAGGGKVLGRVAHAFPGTTDFSSFLLQAQSSGAKVICLANAGEDTLNCMKQAHEFHILGPGQILAVPFLGDPTIQAAGPDVAQGAYYPSPFYWNRDGGTRAFAARLAKLAPSNIANKECANAYSGTLHYLKAVAALGVERAKADGRAVVAQMTAIPMEDPLFGRCAIRADGQAMRDMLLLQVKPPAQPHAERDFCNIIDTLPAAGLYVPLDEGGCRMVHG